MAQNIWEMLQQNPSQAGTQPGKNGLVVAFQLARELQPLLPELLPGILATGQLLSIAVALQPDSSQGDRTNHIKGHRHVAEYPWKRNYAIDWWQA